ncbi:hypothetical protein OG689_26030 [Kitasatospora sp. NBC_00240]|uniref:hypothetical protein n=1 Tax=Kitasatospora sp. NBC_00240 TaxID=2903567 RepID=UPI0022506E72|nr:hypothetical protein [Kitasatospora sp. NBC_00240]MCX5212701.1 hypothetical protein [Kitasatospora sp. NBC_00240]
MSRDETSGLRAALLRLGRLPGYVRQPDLARRSGEQGHTYKKGWEVRFTARTEDEIAEIRDLVVAAGFAPARPFFKGHQLIQPVYGMAVVQAYLAARQAVEENAARAARGRLADGTAEAGSDSARADSARSESVGAESLGADAATSDTARAAAAAGAAAAAAAAGAERARRRAVEAFPAQVERATAADRMDCSDRARKAGPAGATPQGAGRAATDRSAAGARVGAAEAGRSC